MQNASKKIQKQIQEEVSEVEEESTTSEEESELSTKDEDQDSIQGDIEFEEEGGMEEPSIRFNSE